VSVAIGWDDLWLAVICQTSSEIAGSPRNIFKYSLFAKTQGGRALNGPRALGSCVQSNSEYLGGAKGISPAGQAGGARGKQPRFSSKVSKSDLSGKGSIFPQTPRRLA